MGNEDVNLLGKYVNTINEIRNICWLLLRGSGNKCCEHEADETIIMFCAVAYRGEGGWGVQTPPPPPRNSEDIGGVLDRTSKKNRRLDFLS